MKLGWRVPAMLLAVFLVGCSSSGVPRRISEPAASLKLRSSQAYCPARLRGGRQHNRSTPMRCEAVSLALSVEDQWAGTLAAQPALISGRESADVITVPFDPGPDAGPWLA